MGHEMLWLYSPAGQSDQGRARPCTGACLVGDGGVEAEATRTRFQRLGKAMQYVTPNYRTDERLESILFEVGNWSVNGQRGQPLCVMPTLRLAVDKATSYVASGTLVESLSHFPTLDVIVSAAQIERLRKAIAGLELTPIKETNA